MFMIVFQVFDLMGPEDSSEDLSQFVVDQTVGVVFQVSGGSGGGLSYMGVG